MNVSFNNGLEAGVTLNKMYLDAASPDNEYRGLQSGSLNDEIRKKLVEQVHHILDFPLWLEKGSSLIKIAVLPFSSENEFEHPEKRKIILESSSGRMEFPLFNL